MVKNKKENLSLTKKIAVPLTCFVLVVVFLWAVLLYSHIQRTVYRQKTAVMKEALTMEVDIVNEWLNGRRTYLAGVAAYQSLEENPQRVLSEFREHRPKEVEKLFYIDRQLLYHDSQGQTAKVSPQDYKVMSLLSGDRPFFMTPISLSEKEKKPSFSLFLPVVRENQIVGVVGGLFYSQELGQRLETLTFSEEGYGWILNSEGRVIVHPKDERVMKMTLDNSHDLGFKGLKRLKPLIVANDIGSGQYHDAEGRPMLFFFNKTEISDGWIVVFSAPKTFFSGGGLSTAILLLVGGGLIVAATFFFTKGAGDTIKKRLLALNKILNLFLKGNKTIRSKQVSNDEIGQLALAFNRMADTIIAQTDNVEELIKERTSILADLNYQIINRNKELNNMNEELSTTNDKLHHMATTDMLTMLMNRHEFKRMVQKAIDMSLANDQQIFSILFIDLDNFKYYNDTYSHEIGDFVLQEISKILKNNIRDLDLVARYGGDEFVIMLRQGNFQAAQMISQRIHQRIIEKQGFIQEVGILLEMPVSIPAKDRLSCSIGIVNFDKTLGIDQAEELLALADETMYRAKKQGKSQIVIH